MKRRSIDGAGRTSNLLLRLLLLCGCIYLPPSVASADTSTDAPAKVTFTGYAVQSIIGIYYETLMAILREEYPDWTVTGKPSNPAGGLALVVNGEADIVMAATPELRAAMDGIAPFTESFKGKISWVCYANEDVYYYFLATKSWADKASVRTLADIARVKPKMQISSGKKSNLLAVEPSMDLLGRHGITEESVKNWGGDFVWVNAADGMALLQDGKLDVFASLGFKHMSALEDIARVRPLVWLFPDPDTLEQVRAHWLYHVVKIEKGSYPFANEDLETMKGWLAIVTRPDMEPLTIERMLKAWMKHGERIEALGPGFADFRKNLSKYPAEFKNVVPMHPGAQAFFFK